MRSKKIEACLRIAEQSPHPGEREAARRAAARLSQQEPEPAAIELDGIEPYGPPHEDLEEKNAILWHAPWAEAFLQAMPASDFGGRSDCYVVAGFSGQFDAQQLVKLAQANGYEL